MTKASESFRNELKCSKKMIQKTTELRASRYDVAVQGESHDFIRPGIR